ncbi:MAG: 50S ribosomal protein L16 [Candidatus Firestonebacteria bacterium]
MLFPKRVKFRRSMRGRMRGVAISGSEFNFGEYAIKSTECSWVTARQIEAARVTIVRSMKKGGKVWLRIFPDKPVSKKPAEVRMGGGKPGPEFWVAVVKPGRILFEVAGVTEEVAREALKMAGYKLPVLTKFIKRAD